MANYFYRTTPCEDTDFLLRLSSMPSPDSMKAALRSASPEFLQELKEDLNKIFETLIDVREVTFHQDKLIVRGILNEEIGKCNLDLQRMIRRVSSDVPVEFNFINPVATGFKISIYDGSGNYIEKIHAKASPTASSVRPKTSQFISSLLKSIPEGVFVRKATPFECRLPQGNLRGVHLDIEAPEYLNEELAAWRSDFEEQNKLVLHIRRDWARTSVGSILRRLSPGKSLLTHEDIGRIETHLTKRFDSFPMFGVSVDTMPAGALFGKNDLTDLKFVTIDNENTRNMEDAVYAEKNPDGTYTLYSAIVDVTWFIRPNTPGDEYAASRAFSVYGGHLAYPLLGTDFSNGLGSLVQGELRPAWVGKSLISATGEVKDFTLMRAVIQSKERLNLDDVQEMNNRSALPPHITTLAECAQLIRNHRVKTVPFAIGDFSLGKVELIVPEAMILLNAELGEYFRRLQLPGIFTTYTPPSIKQKEELVQRMRTEGIVAEVTDFNSPESFAQLWQRLREKASPALLQETLDRFFPRSMYGTIPEAHDGVPAPTYLRIKGDTYAGVVNQWLLQAITEHEERPFTQHDLEQIAARQNRRKAARASISSVVYVLGNLAKHLTHVGEDFSSKVTHCHPEGCYIEIQDPSFPQQGFLPVEKHYDLPLSQGSTLKVILQGFNLQRRYFEYQLKGES